MVGATSKAEPVVQGFGTRSSSLERDPLLGICDNLRARAPIALEKRSGPSLLDGLPDIHDVLGL